MLSAHYWSKKGQRKYCISLYYNVDICWNEQTVTANHNLLLILYLRTLSFDCWY